MKDFYQWSINEIAGAGLETPPEDMAGVPPETPEAPPRPTLDQKWADHMKARSGLDPEAARRVEHPILNSGRTMAILNAVIKKSANGDPAAEAQIYDDFIAHFQHRKEMLKAQAAQPSPQM